MCPSRLPRTSLAYGNVSSMRESPRSWRKYSSGIPLRTHPAAQVSRNRLSVQPSPTYVRSNLSKAWACQRVGLRALCVETKPRKLVLGVQVVAADDPFVDGEARRIGQRDFPALA